MDDARLAEILEAARKRQREFVRLVEMWRRWSRALASGEKVNDELPRALGGMSRDQLIDQLMYALGALERAEWTPDLSDGSGNVAAHGNNT